ncbi:sulfatase [candidate division CSSED10-310 bacterium]|uniref:Sulfatase n=1 Tax=candidate division CSSED10-310 bacterium TaxID=2855610 RepID=A0ABV6YUE8_UNCC1
MTQDDFISGLNKKETKAEQEQYLRRAGVFLFIIFLGMIGLIAYTVLFDRDDGVSNTSPPNIVLISIDTLRADHSSLYGYPKSTTPTLDRLGKESAWFGQAITPAPWTLPAHMSVMTGLPASIHRVQKGKDSLPNSVSTLAEVLQKSGYQTAAFVSHVMVGKKYGFARGFQHFVEKIRNNRAHDVSERAIKWLESAPQEPFFLFIHYFDPHWPFFPPQEYAQMFGSGLEHEQCGKFKFLKKYSNPDNLMTAEILHHLTALYDGEIRYTDLNIDRVVHRLQSLNLLDKTVIVVFSDHGEELQERGSFGHGHSFFPEVINVLLLVRYPAKIPANTKISEIVSISDIPATLAACAGIQIPAQFVDRSWNLLELLQHDSKPESRTILLESTRRGPKRLAGIEGIFKYMMPFRFSLYTNSRIFASVEEGLYDVSADPAHNRNLITKKDRAESLPLEPDPESLVSHAIQSDIHEYILGTSTALMLLFSPAAEKDSPGVFSGEITFQENLQDEPFGFRLEQGDVFEPVKPYLQYRFSFKTGSNKKVILFPAQAENQDVSLTMTYNEKQCFKQVFHLSAVKNVMQPLGPDQNDPLCWLTWRRSVGEHVAGSAELSTSQLESLRSLGYIQ